MTIIIDGKKADYAGNNINLVFNTPIFQDYGGEAAVDVRFPITDTNKMIFGYQHRTDSAIKKSTHSVIFKIGGFEKVGQGKLNRITSSEFEMSVGFENSDFYHIIKDKTLKDLPWGNPFSCGANNTVTGGLSEEVSFDYAKIKINTQTQTKLIKVEGLQRPLTDNGGMVDGTFTIYDGYQLRIAGYIEVDHASECRLELWGGSVYETDDKKVIKYFGRYFFVGTPLKTTVISTGQNNQIDIRYNQTELLNEKGQKYEAYRIYLSCDSKKVDKKERIKVRLESMQLYLETTGKTFVKPKPYPSDSYALPGFYAPAFLSNIEDSSDEATRFGSWPKVNHYEKDPSTGDYHYPPYTVIDETGSIIAKTKCP